MRKRVSPSLVVSCVALVFAMAGTGVAATGYRITSIWQIAPKVRHQLRGVPGSPGAQGRTGLQGPIGPAGKDASMVTYVRQGDAVELLTADQNGEAVARCNSGDTVLGGGYVGSGEVVTSQLSIAPQGEGDPGHEPAPAKSSDWAVVAHLDPAAATGDVTAWALCGSIRAG